LYAAPLDLYKEGPKGCQQKDNFKHNVNTDTIYLVTIYTLLRVQDKEFVENAEEKKLKGIDCPKEECPPHVIQLTTVGKR
jgi:hypothetical protein